MLKDDNFWGGLRLIRVLLSGLKPFDREALRIRRRRALHLEGFGVVVDGAPDVVVDEVIGHILRRSKSFSPSSWHSRQSFQRGSAGC